MIKRKKMAQRKSKFLSSSYLVAKKLAEDSPKGETRITQVIFGTVQLSISMVLSILC